MKKELEQEYKNFYESLEACVMTLKVYAYYKRNSWNRFSGKHRCLSKTIKDKENLLTNMRAVLVTMQRSLKLLEREIQEDKEKYEKLKSSPESQISMVNNHQTTK